MKLVSELAVGEDVQESTGRTLASKTFDFLPALSTREGLGKEEQYPGSRATVMSSGAAPSRCITEYHAASVECEER
jgi:hypothetical protein